MNADDFIGTRYFGITISIEKYNFARMELRTARPSFILFAILLAASISLQCTKDESVQPVLDIHPDFQPLVDLFVTEATQRGINLTIDNLILQYDPGLSQFTCAECNSSESLEKVQKQILVNPNSNI